MIKHTDRLLNASNGRGLQKPELPVMVTRSKVDPLLPYAKPLNRQGSKKPVAWLHRMDNTEGIKSNGKGVVVIDEYRPHPFGLVGVDFDESYPITSTPLYTSAQQQKPWVGLTPEDYDSMRPRVPYIVNDFSFADVAAIVEAKT